MAAKKPVRAIERRRGDTWKIRVDVMDEDGAPVNVTGSTSAFVVDTRRYPPPTETATRKFSLAGTIVDGPGGVIEFTPTTEAADTAAGNYYYEVKLTVGGSTVTVANEAYTVL